MAAILQTQRHIQICFPEWKFAYFDWNLFLREHTNTSLVYVMTEHAPGQHLCECWQSSVKICGISRTYCVKAVDSHTYIQTWYFQRIYVCKWIGFIPALWTAVLIGSLHETIFIYLSLTNYLTLIKLQLTSNSMEKARVITSHQRTQGCLGMMRNLMMTSSNGNLFRVTGPLWGETTGHRWILLTKASDAGIWFLFDLHLNKWLSKQQRRRWFETTSCSLWRHCNAWVWWELCGKCRLYNISFLFLNTDRYSKIHLIYLCRELTNLLPVWENFQWKDNAPFIVFCVQNTLLYYEVFVLLT